MGTSVITIPREIEAAADSMPSVSPILGKINQMTHEMETSPRELVKIIMLDPTLTANVLKLVNSSFYGLLQRVTSLAQAVVLLGMNTVKNLAVSTALLSTVFMRDRRSPIPPEAFWRHCLATAIGCKLLARSRRMTAEALEMYFIGGMLHDIGKILFIRINPSQYSRAIQESHRLAVSLSFAELAHFGCTHTQAGELLARKWRLDNCLAEVIAQHHRQEGLETMPFTMVAAVANNLSKQAGAGESGNPVIEEYADDLARNSAIDNDLKLQICRQLPAELEKAAAFLNLVQEH